jgi:cytosine/adenosine deaminase-related metal-dependent hydrolase
VRGRHRAVDLLAAATSGGYASLGWPDGGAIRPGALADLIAIRTDGVRLAGVPSSDLVDGTVFAAAPGDVREVIVGGRFIVRGGAHVSLDAERELATAIASVAS